jgi:hypothetical protein
MAVLRVMFGKRDVSCSVYCCHNVVTGVLSRLLQGTLILVVAAAACAAASAELVKPLQYVHV